MRLQLILATLLAIYVSANVIPASSNDKKGVPYVVDQNIPGIEETILATNLTAFILPAVCKEPSNIGNGTVTSVRWFFDFERGHCRQFSYTGQGGNGNSFPNKIACETKCTYDPCKKVQINGSWLGALLVGGSRVSCIVEETTNNDLCPLDYYCALNLGICCRQETSDICNLPVAHGTKTSLTLAKPSFFYNSTSKACEMFDFNGIEGNQNRFEFLHECEDACMNRACTIGHPFSKAKGPLKCTPGEKEEEVCPGEYRCVRGSDKLKDTFVCCLPGNNLATEDGVDGPMTPVSSSNNLKAFVLFVFGATILSFL